MQHWTIKTKSDVLQKQPSMKRCSENMPQVYKRTHMPKCDFNKVAKQELLRILDEFHVYSTFRVDFRVSVASLTRKVFDT